MKVMKISKATVVTILVMAPVGYALAQSAPGGIGVGSSDDVNFAPLITLLQPYIISSLGVILTALAGWVAKKIHDKTGVDIQASQIATWKDAAKTEVGSMVAAADDNLAGRTFHVGSPVIAAAVSRIEARLPDLTATLKANGATPEALEAIVTGEIGKIQVAQTVTPPVPDKDAAPVTAPTRPLPFK